MRVFSAATIGLASVCGSIAVSISRVVFASEDARSSITGWVRRAADVFGVELHVVDIAPELREEILATQEAQKMVNVELPTAADDLTIE